MHTKYSVLGTQLVEGNVLFCMVIFSYVFKLKVRDISKSTIECPVNIIEQTSKYYIGTIRRGTFSLISIQHEQRGFVNRVTS